jgi:Protein of unknown function (DUF4238)
MTDYKSNHYVPQMLSKRFMSDKGELYYFDKNKPEKPLEKRNPKSIFCENNLYVTIDRSGNRNHTLESEVYKKLDNEANLIIEKIVTAARQNELPQLTITEKSTWDEFLIQQWQRTPDAFSEFNRNFDFESEYAISIANYEKLHRQLNYFERIIWDCPLTKQVVRKTAHLQSLKDNRRDLSLKALSSRGVGIARISNPQSSFIIGSFPVLRLSFKNQTLADPATEVWLPISHDVIVTPSGSKHEEKLVNIGQNQVRRINELIFNQSTEIASRSKLLLESLCGKIKSVRKTTIPSP